MNTKDTKGRYKHLHYLISKDRKHITISLPKTIQYLVQANLSITPVSNRVDKKSLKVIDSKLIYEYNTANYNSIKYIEDNIKFVIDYMYIICDYGTPQLFKALLKVLVNRYL